MDFISQLAAAHRQIEEENQRRVAEHTMNVGRYDRQRKTLNARNARLKETQRAAIDAAVTIYWESSSEIAARVGCVRSSAYKHLVVMEEKGIVERKGDSKHTKWRRKHDDVQ